MKERPITFQPSMALATLQHRKTQTRPVMRVQPDRAPIVYPATLDRAGKNKVLAAIWGDETCLCPYGVVGDRLWVRETLGAECYASKRWDTVWYEADHEDVEGVPEEWAPPSRSIRRHEETGDNIPQGGFPYWTAKVPSIFMPRWASRITLEVTGVRVERLQEISEADAKAEGVAPNWIGPLDKGPNGFGGEGWVEDCGWEHYTNGIDGDPAYTTRESFESLWHSINGRESWDANPWVWVVGFERVAQAERAAA